jgi:hypothetical protein
MDKQTLKQVVKVPTVQEIMGKKMPERKFRAGGISTTIWENEVEHDGKKTSYFTISIERNYLDKKTNQWQSTNSMRVTDLPKAILVINKAYEYLMLKDTVSIEEESY